MSVAEDNLLVRAGWVGPVRAVLDAGLLPSLVRQMLNNQLSHASNASPTMDAAQAPAQGAFGTRAFQACSTYVYIDSPMFSMALCRAGTPGWQNKPFAHIEALLHASALCIGLQR